MLMTGSMVISIYLSPGRHERVHCDLHISKKEEVKTDLKGTCNNSPKERHPPIKS